MYAQVCPSLVDQKNGEGNVKVDCGYLSGTNCIDLIASFPTLASTDSYAVSSTPYTPYGDYNDGTQLDIYPVEPVRDEDYLKRISFNNPSFFSSKSFEFSFYGKKYDSFIISSNGFISFRSDIAEGDFSSSDFGGQTIPTTMVPTLSVFGVYQDVEFVKGESTISIKVEGAYPCRKLVVNFYRARIVGTNQYTTSQIVLEELTGDIYVYVKDKPLPDNSARRKSSVIGVSDNTGDGVAPATRNTGIWSASNEGWHFSPNGPNMTREIQWYNNGVRMAAAYNNKLRINVCPKLDVEQYKAIAVYTLANGDVIKAEKEINYFFSGDFPIATDVTDIICSGSTGVYYQSNYYSKILSPTTPSNPYGPRSVSNFNFKFYDTRPLAQSGATAPIDPALALQNNKIYYVRVENKSNPTTCFTVIAFKIEDVNNVLLANVVDICSDNLVGITLSKLRCQLFDASFKPTSIKYKIDNTSGPFVTTANLTAASKIYVYATTSCGEIIYGPITINITTGAPLLPVPNPININLCDIVIPGKNPPLKETDFDWQKYFKKNGIVFSNDPDAIITVHPTKELAADGKNAMNYIDEGSPLPSKDYTYTLGVRVTPSTVDPTLCKNECSSSTEITVRVEFSKIIINVDDADKDAKPDDPEVFDVEDVNLYLCKSTVDRTIDPGTDFNSFVQITKPTAGAGIYRYFYRTLKDATDSLAIPILESSLPHEVLLSTDKIKTYFVKYSLGVDPTPNANHCYVIKQFVYNVENFQVLSNAAPFQVCSPNNQLITIKLSDYINRILAGMQSQNPKPEVKFYLDPGGTTEITTLDLDATTPSKSVYVRITSGYNPSCISDLIEYKFVLKGIELLKNEVTLNITCDDDADGKIYVNLKKYETEFASDPSLIKQYYRNYNPANGSFTNPIPAAELENFETVSSGQQIIYIRFSQTGSTCTAMAKIIINVNITNTPIKLRSNRFLLRCNIVGQSAIFNLNDIISRIYDPSNPEYSSLVDNVYFYVDEVDAKNDKNRIPNPDNYSIPVTESRKQIWVRFESKTGCKSIEVFTIKVINPADIKFTNQPEPPIIICDDNLDGKYTFDLRAWVNAKIDSSVPGSSFLNDYENTLGADYSFQLSSGGTDLTSQEEKNFHPDPVSQNFVWIKASAGGDCNAIMKLTFDFGDISVLNFNIGDFCANETVDLTQIKSDPRIAGATELKFYRSDADLIAGSGQITNETQFDAGALTEVYVKIIFPGTACPRKGIISLHPKLVPEFTMETNLIDFCEISQKVDINIDPSNIISLGLKPVSYTIKGPNAFVETGAYAGKTIYTTNIPGEYTVTITADNACSYTAAPVVLRQFDVPQITSIIVESDRVMINTISKSPNRPIEYSYDGLGSWQASNVFFNVPKGVRSFVVRYADNGVENGCTSTPKEAYILSISNVITPNGDGVNDVWKVTDLDFYEGKPTTVQIFDRFNKIVFEKSSTDTLIWDGRTNGRPVPSTTYWFIMKLPDGNELKGWIMVKHSE